MCDSVQKDPPPRVTFEGHMTLPAFERTRRSREPPGQAVEFWRGLFKAVLLLLAVGLGSLGLSLLGLLT
jgi:hypothetical protein